MKKAIRESWWYLAPIIGSSAVIVYWFTAHRTITWWDSIPYTMAAMTLGVVHPPGSLLATLLGWAVVKLVPSIPDVVVLNLLAGLLAVTTVLLCGLIAVRLFQSSSATAATAGRSGRKSGGLMLAVAIGASCLNFAFGQTLWSYAVKFTPYVLTAVFTCLILLAIIRWLNNSVRHPDYFGLFIVMLLFGLDFSVHRTNALLAPGFALIVLFHRTRTLALLKNWLYGFAGILLGLAFHLLLIPIAASKPLVNFNDPSNWSRFYDYISVKVYGANWLVQFYPRKADFWGEQLGDYLGDFAANFAHIDGILSVLGYLPLLLGLFGLISIWRLNRILASTLTILFLCTSFGAVVYFNMPEGFFRSMDRHYLPSFVIFAIFAAFGAARLTAGFGKYASGRRSVLSVGMILLLAAVSYNQINRNYDDINGSRRTFAYDYAHGIIKTLPENAIVIISGDVYWSVRYMQVAEQLRPDVSVMSRSLMNTDWYMKQMLEAEPSIPLSLTVDDLVDIGPRVWNDTTINLSIARHPDSAEGGTASSLEILVPATIDNSYLLAQDWLLVDMLIENNWKRPICFNETPEWLNSTVRSEGLFSRMVAEQTPKVDCDLLKTNLFEKIKIRGFDNLKNPITMMSKYSGNYLIKSHLQLADCLLERGDSVGVKEVLSRVESELHPERTMAHPNFMAYFEELAAKVDYMSPTN